MPGRRSRIPPGCRAADNALSACISGLSCEEYNEYESFFPEGPLDYPCEAEDIAAFNCE